LIQEGRGGPPRANLFLIEKKKGKWRKTEGLKSSKKATSGGERVQKRVIIGRSQADLKTELDRTSRRGVTGRSLREKVRLRKDEPAFKAESYGEKGLT